MSHGSSSVPPSFFVDHKRGEVNELKLLLNNPKLLREQDKKREVIKKVIAYMTLGIDVSRVFSEMVMAASTKDLVQKKMVYHYLCNYAQQKADLAILAINTLQKDCRDEDPMVRGLALRSLCSLRIANISEYVMIPLRQSLNDPSAYVRKTAVLGIAKLYHFVPDAIKSTDLVDILYNMLKDKDPLVITNVIHALNELLATEGANGGGGMVINHAIMLYLLNRIKEFNEWGQTLVLELAAKYQPKDESAVFDVMNLLEDRLKHSNSAVVLGTTKVFLNYTQAMPRVHEEVYKRLKAPLLTLMAGGSHELSFAILAHIHLLVQRNPAVFADSFKHFFVRYNDPSSVKLQKLAILTQLATPASMVDILLELAEYVTDMDADISRFAVRSIGRIAIRIPEAAEESIEHLLAFLKLRVAHVTSETVVVLKDFLRKYPDRYEDIIPSLTRALRTIDEPEGKQACIWMVGEYGETIDEAPYILESLIDSWEDEQDNLVKMELLTATMRLFFKRPPEIKNMLAKLLKQAINTQASAAVVPAFTPTHGAGGAQNAAPSKIVHIDVRDRALTYYRLLQFDVHEAARVVNSAKKSTGAAVSGTSQDSGRSLLFAEQVDVELYDKIFREFNSLSVVYATPQERFVKAPVYDEEEEKKREQEELAKAEAESSSAALTGGQTSAEGAVADAEDILPSNVLSTQSSPPAAAGAAAGAAAPSGQVDLLGDFMSSLEVSSPQASPASAGPTLSFLPGQTLDKATYQSKWSGLPVAGQLELSIRSRPITAQLVEQLLSSSANIITFASGGVGANLKFFLFGRDASSLYLIEMNVDSTSGRLVATFKTDSPMAATNAPLLSTLITKALQPIC